MQNASLILGIALFGAFGAVVRYMLSGWANQLSQTGFPWGTLLVNVVGCFLLGVLVEWEILSDRFPSHVRIMIAVGFLGALTTYSTFGHETFASLERGDWNTALANIGMNMMLGLLAVASGVFLVRRLMGM